MAVILSTADLKYITGRQARAIHKAPNRNHSGVFREYGNGFKVENSASTTNVVKVMDGLCMVDGAVVENTEAITLTLPLNGTWHIIVRVNLTNGMSPTVDVTATQSNLVQDDLTLNTNGINEYELATVTVASGSISNNVDTRAFLEVDSYTKDYIDSTYYTRSFINTYFPTKEYILNNFYTQNQIAANYYNKSYIYDNYYQKSVLYTQNQCKAYFKSIDNTRANREVLMYTGASYLETGQSITLLTGGYAISSFERLVFVFSNYVTGTGAVDNGGGQIAIDNFGVTGAFDGFYNIQTRAFNVDINSAGGTAVSTAVKSWVLASNKVLTGNSNGSSVNKNLVLRSVIGIVTEEAYDSANSRSVSRPASLNLNLPTIPADEVAPDAPLVVMASANEVYDTSNLSAEELQVIKEKLGMENVV